MKLKIVFAVLLASFVFIVSSAAAAAEVTITCARAVAFRAADTRGNPVPGSLPVVLRAETNARIEVRGEKTISLEPYRSKVVAVVDLAIAKWRDRTNQNVSPLKMIRRVSVTDESFVGDETHCWSSKHANAAQYRAIVDGWPKETLPISSLVSVGELAASQIQAKPVAIEYKFADSGATRRSWVRVPNPQSVALFHVFAVVEYRETTTDSSGQTDVATYELSEERSGVYASSEDGAYSQVRASILDRIAAKEEALGRRWHLVNDAKEKRVNVIRGAK